jgi:hypothetical protein
MTGKKRAQAMVEFALALPILLLLLYGILEAGRLLFIYSSVVTASRQAVRYGSATGMGLDYTADGGPNNSTFERYRDCYGIRRAAQRADFLNSFEDSDIRIYYDAGPATTENEICTGGANNWSDFGPNNNTRLVVRIDGDFLPIVPRLVPFIERSSARGNPIEGDSARTILVSVSIYVTAPPSTWVPSTPTTAPDTPTASATLPPTATNTPPPTDTPEPTRTRRNDPTSTVTGTATQTGTATVSPTTTMTGTATNTGTPLPTATSTGTAVSQCLQLSAGAISKSGNTMSLTLTNPNSYPITIDYIFVRWNGDDGHQAGSDKSLDLTSVSLGSTVIWTGLIDGASSVTIDPTSSATVSGSAVNLSVNFNFHQSYDNWDNPPTEQVTIYFDQPTGCTINPINVSR